MILHRYNFILALKWRWITIGKSREIKFKTSRQLREGAYLKLEFLNIAGVRNWEEVQLEELPEKVKANYQK